MGERYPLDAASWQRAAIAHVGSVFFVDDSSANDSNNPSSGTWQEPFTTLAYALTQCTANAGDVVYAKQGHSESMATALALTAVARTTIVMLRFGATWTMGGVAGSLEAPGGDLLCTRVTAALPQATSTAIFTVTGLVLLKNIVGYVTTVIGAVANATKLLTNSTGAGANTDLCATVELNAAAVDTRYEITGTFANALLATIDIPKLKTLVIATFPILPIGTIELSCAGSDGGTGRMRWSCLYQPLEVGARIIAA